MIHIHDPYCERERERYQHERKLLASFPALELKEIIREVGFACTCCGRCCTTPFNGHVFLLDADARKAKDICPDALIPAPDFEVCDRSGIFYVSGYALRAHPDGRCIHLTENNRCFLYKDRFTICRVYPYMQHREPDDQGRLEFRQISGLNEHGEYNICLSDEEIARIAEETMAYEDAWLEQMIRFYSLLEELNGFRQVRRVYDDRMRAFLRGEAVEVNVFYHNSFVAHTVTIQDYSGILP